ncbi:XRE family transcriptional regulator [Lysinibacillus sphaericus]|uniref:helix-turn-helix domain-containing protein n=1 Tax=Lysinibacillus sphaericus TaxID=1421 RepID=UPI0018CE3177|nr:helix-turn-helix transcriptional regulator [Lysinibacillus sphaericus]MBG9456009.1 XRE family transcriptional regulator [Lysinibacillus sphaericus]MBG9479654.1 XRE family transcriptional regulator [Lysinibacillus sphaericus]MBG9593864.1 XRE family transcriptional regulator [Lysinibacillus sphaericus]
MNELGQRIKKLRIEKGMTLVELTGNKMSKGMLSMIENGRANPSMDSLKFIAHQLGCDLQYLLGSPTPDELKNLFNILEEEYEKNNDEQIINLTQNIFDQQFPISLESARILEISGRTVMKSDEKNGEMLIDRAISIYDRLSLYSHCLAVKLYVVEHHAKKGEYLNALNMLRNVRKEYDEKAKVIDMLVKLEANYVEMVLLFGIGEYKSGKEKLNQLIVMAKKRMVYYKMDNIFRIAAFQALLHNDENDYAYFIKKSEQFAVFSENDKSLAYTLLLQAHYYNQIPKDYEQALFYLDKFATVLKGNIGSDFYYLEKGKALLGKGQLNEALEAFEKFKMPGSTTYPLELCILYTAYSYRAICLMQIGKIEEALIYAKKAASNIDSLPKTHYQDFIKNTIDLVNTSL